MNSIYLVPTGELEFHAIIINPRSLLGKLLEDEPDLLPFWDDAGTVIDDEFLEWSAMVAWGVCVGNTHYVAFGIMP